MGIFHGYFDITRGYSLRELIQTSGETALFVVDHPAALTWLDGLQFENPCVWRSPVETQMYIYIYIYVYIYNIYNIYIIYIYTLGRFLSPLFWQPFFMWHGPSSDPSTLEGQFFGERIPGGFCQRLTGIHCRQLWDLRWKWATSSMNIFGVLLFTSLDIFWSTCCCVGPKVLNHLGLFFAPPS